MLEQLAASELLPEQSPLDKALDEIGDRIDKAKKTCEKLMILMERRPRYRRVAPKCLQNMHGRNFKRAMMNFQ